MQKQPLEVFLGKVVLKICNKFTGEHLFRSAISIKLQSNFIEITLWHVFSAVNLLYIFRKLFPKNTSGRLLLSMFSHYFTEPKTPQKIKNTKHLVETLIMFFETLQSNVKKKFRIKSFHCESTINKLILVAHKEKSV